MKEADMFGTLLRKEIMENLNNQRFVGGLLAVVLLTLLCAIVLTNQYSQDLKDYQGQLSQQNEIFDNYMTRSAVGGRLVTPPRAPHRLSPLVRGIRISSMGGSIDEDSLNVLFPPFDLVFIIAYIMSLLALLFSYNAFTGERENGTLSLMASNPLSRAKLLLGKWAGGCLSLMIILLIAILVGTIYISVEHSGGWTATEYAAIGLLTIAACLYISLFHLIGMSVSATAGRSSSAILASLFIWVLVILVIPNASPYIAAQIFKTPPIHVFEMEMNRLDSTERDEIARAIAGKARDEFMQSATSEEIAIVEAFLDNDKDTVAAMLEKQPSLKETLNTYKTNRNNAWMKANEIQREKRHKLNKDFENRLIAQMLGGVVLSSLSPYADFMYAASELTASGVGAGFHYMGRRSERERQMFDFIQEKSEEAKKADPMFGNNTKLDLSGRPAVVNGEPPLLQRLLFSLPNMAVLIFMNIIVFTIAFRQVVRFDVRQQ